MEKAPDQLELVLRYFTEFSPVQLRQLSALQDLYKEWNDKINVISRKDIDSLYEKHVLHSLAIAAAFELTEGMEVIDIGTGGGFPGIPLAIFFPKVRFHLVDSIGKKIKVVEAVRDAIGLENVTTQHGRAEEIKNRKFDVAVSRAVAPLKELWTWSRPLLRKPVTTQPRTRTSPSDPASPAIPAPNPNAPNDLNNPNNPNAHNNPNARNNPKLPNAPNDPKLPNNAAAPNNTPADSEALPVPHGLVCLKGGDLAAEIAESGTRPRMMELNEIFSEPYFQEKYLLYVPLGK